MHILVSTIGRTQPLGFDTATSQAAVSGFIHSLEKLCSQVATRCVEPTQKLESAAFGGVFGTHTSPLSQLCLVDFDEGLQILGSHLRASTLFLCECMQLCCASRTNGTIPPGEGVLLSVILYVVKHQVHIRRDLGLH